MLRFIFSTWFLITDNWQRKEWLAAIHLYDVSNFKNKKEIFFHYLQSNILKNYIEHLIKISNVVQDSRSTSLLSSLNVLLNVIDWSCANP